VSERGGKQKAARSKGGGGGARLKSNCEIRPATRRSGSDMTSKPGLVSDKSPVEFVPSCPIQGPLVGPF